MGIPTYINLALRGLQFLWTLLIMAIVGNMISEATTGNPSIINYSMFVAVIAMISLFYLIPATYKPNWAIHPVIMIAVDLINTLFFFCGGVALAAELGAHSCGNIPYVRTNSVTNGSNNPSKRCHEAQATTAFMWFAFAAFAASTALSGLQQVQSGGGSKGSSRPAMSQV